MPTAPPAPSVTPPPPSVIVDDEIARLLRSAIGLRAMVAPLLGLIVGFVVWIDPTPWRWILLVTVLTLVISASALVEWRVRRVGVAASSLARNLMGMVLAQLVVITATGGVDSPLLPVTIPFAILASLMLGRRPATLMVVGTQVITVAVLTTLQGLERVPALDLAVLHEVAPGQRVAVGAVVCLVLVLGTGLGLTVRERFEAMVSEAVRAREDQLGTWVSWSRDLEAIGGEIAHELKNPLASIKGLSALVARDLPPGRAAERMEVLQGEVERMRGILDEFLTFSRPLTPLTREAIDPRALAARVVALHEGAARTHGARLELQGQARALQADPRKLLQVLVNLVQNALAASSGGVVRVAVADDAGRVVFTVADRGPGIDPALRDRVFSAGVTSKADGSGLGLPIALAIVHQHDGELALDERPGGGTVARVTLP